MRLEFINTNNHSVSLQGPDKRIETFRRFEKKVLPDYFKRYVPRYLKLVSEAAVVQPKTVLVRKINNQAVKPPRKKPLPVIIRKINNQAINNRAPVPVQTTTNRPLPVVKHMPLRTYRSGIRSSQIVGKVSMTSEQATAYYKNMINKITYPISNDVGVGILSFNRLSSLHRLLVSIRENTDLSKTTIFISDESTNADVKDYISKIPDMVVLNNNERLGIAGNTNRLMRCLARFRYKIILNDDVIVKRQGWDWLYAKAFQSTEYHHFCMRQPGVYGATEKDGQIHNINGHGIRTIQEKPQGAIIAFDHTAFQKVGYFDESFGLYGMEHVDWSERVSASGIQPPGFHDVTNSVEYFTVFAETSEVEGRGKLLSDARQKLNELRSKNRIYVNTSERSAVPIVSYIIPFRGADRTGAIKTVVQNIKAQHYPAIDIIITEQDDEIRVRHPEYETITHEIAISHKNGDPFTKAIAFNVGVKLARAKKLILHDADIMVESKYTKKMCSLLDQYHGVHIGKSVLYLDEASTPNVIASQKMAIDHTLNRMVSYFEGGSLGCTFDTYCLIGGFNEDFIGYGCFCPGGDNFVLTDSGYKQIEYVTEKDMLYTHEGRFNKIKLRSRNYSGDVLDIFIPGRLPIKGVTLVHPFLIEDGDKFRWCKACDLKEGDQILDTDFIPEMVKPYDFNDIIKFDKTKNKFDIYEHMDEFCYLLGLYIAEGVLQTPERLRIIYYYLSKDENFLVEHIVDIIHLLNDDINVTYHFVKNNCREVRVFNSLLAKLIFAVAGKKDAINKIISSKFLEQLNSENVEFLLGGMFDGDANHGKGSEKRLIYHTSSINLAMIISGQLRRLGISHSFGKRNGGSFEGSSEYSYDLCINREFEHKIKLVYKVPPVVGSSSFGRSKFGTIFKIKKHHYSGPVYNFEVENDHSYVVNGLVVHNCEDCEFYYRLMGHGSFFGDRTEDFVHLWHGRSHGWKEWHRLNKDKDAAFRQRPIDQYMSELSTKLKTKYGIFSGQIRL